MTGVSSPGGWGPQAPSHACTRMPTQRYSAQRVCLLPWTETERERHRHKGRGHVRREAETGEMRPQAKGRLGPPGAGGTMVLVTP